MDNSLHRLQTATEIHRLESIAHASDEVRRRKKRQQEQKKRRQEKQLETSVDPAEEMEGRLLPADEDEDYDDDGTHLDVLV